MAKIFVTGASGFAGSYICKELIKRGHEVFGLIRHRAVNSYHPSLKVLDGDLSNIELLYQHLHKNNISYVIHVAAVVADWGPWHIFYNTNVEGTEKLLEASKMAKINFFIYISTIDVMDYHLGKHQILSELTPYTKSKHYYQRSKTMAELKVLLASDYFKVVTLRPAWIFGPGDKTTFPEIIQTLKNWFVPLPGKKNTYMPLIYVENLANFIADLLTQENQLPNSLKINLVDDIKITWRNLIELLRKHFNRRAIIINLPISVCFIMTVILEFIYKLFRLRNRPTITIASLSMLASSIEVDNQLMKRYSKSKFIDFDTAINRTIEWYKVNPLLRKNIN